MTTVLAEGVYFGEGPRWHDGRLWFSDFYAPAVFAVDASGRVERIVEVPQQPSGLGWLPDGRLLVVSMRDRKILRLDPGGLVEHADLSAVATSHCNDMLVGPTGRAYVGNLGFRAGAGEPRQPAAIARVDPDGTVHVAAMGLHIPNGTVLTPDGRTLIVAETRGERLTAFDVLPDGALTNQRVWASLPSVWPDGIALDAEGAVWVANAVGPECLRVGEGGTILARVATSNRCFACALGGPDRQTLYLITGPTGMGDEAIALRGGKVETTRVEVPGAGWP